MAITFSRTCPDCESRGSFRRSRRRGLLGQIARLLGLKAYRCRACRRRTLSWLDLKKVPRGGQTGGSDSDIRPILAPPSPPGADDISEYDRLVQEIAEDERRRASDANGSES